MIHRTKLQALLEFIAQDSLENALKFERELLARVENLGSMPRKYRQSIHFSDPNIHDFIFKLCRGEYQKLN